VLPGRVCSYEADAARPGGYLQHLGNANTVGDGGLYASVRELLLWERAWHQQWHQPDSLLRALLQPSPLNDGVAPSYRFGLEWLQRHGQDVVFHGGCLWGFNTMLLRLPQQRLSIIQLSNTSAVEPDWKQLVDAALA
jgi:CubicO group peptidase (beta-lactamase class C family)